MGKSSILEGGLSKLSLSPVVTRLSRDQADSMLFGTADTPLPRSARLDRRPQPGVESSSKIPHCQWETFPKLHSLHPRSRKVSGNALTVGEMQSCSPAQEPPAEPGVPELQTHERHSRVSSPAKVVPPPYRRKRAQAAILQPPLSPLFSQF